MSQAACSFASLHEERREKLGCDCSEVDDVRFRMMIDSTSIQLANSHVRDWSQKSNEWTFVFTWCGHTVFTVHLFHFVNTENASQTRSLIAMMQTEQLSVLCRNVRAAVGRRNPLAILVSLQMSRSVLGIACWQSKHASEPFRQFWPVTNCKYLWYLRIPNLNKFFIWTGLRGTADWRTVFLGHASVGHCSGTR